MTSTRQGFMSRLFGAVRRMGRIGEDPWDFSDVGNRTAAGAPVTEQSSLGVTAVWGAVRLISSTIASLPLVVFRSVEPAGKVRAKELPLYRLLHSQPNPEQTAFAWRSLTSVHQLLWGAGISEIEYDASGTPVALWPLPPWRVTAKRNDQRQLYYEVRGDDGQPRQLQPWRVLVFSSMATTSTGWMSPIAIHRETIGQAVAMQQYGAKVFGQGTNPAGIISHPGKLKESSEQTLRESFKQYQGLGGAHRLMLLEEGMKFDRIGIPPEDAQYLQSKEHSVEEIARIYCVPLHLLQSTSKVTSWGSGIEEQNLGFTQFTLRPYFVQWEQEIWSKLIGDDSIFAEFIVEGLLRGRTADRYAAHAVGRQWGWLSANDVRAIENLNPVDGGDIYLTPANMSDANAPAKQAPADEPSGEPTDNDENGGDDGE